MGRVIALLVVLFCVAFLTGCVEIAPRQAAITVMTWNVRGYPESVEDGPAFLSGIVDSYAPDILCIQEIANDDRVASFVAAHPEYGEVAFQNSSDGQDNAIFVRQGSAVTDLPDPAGFQHPAQLATVHTSGIDMMVLTVHLSFSDKERRRQERETLVAWVAPLIASDAAVIVAGDFNTEAETEDDTIEDLATRSGLIVLETGAGVATTCGGSIYDFILISPCLAESWEAAAQVVTPSSADRDLACDVSDHFPVFATLVGEGKATGCTGP